MLFPPNQSLFSTIHTSASAPSICLHYRGDIQSSSCLQSKHYCFALKRLLVWATNNYWSTPHSSSRLHLDHYSFTLESSIARHLTHPKECFSPTYRGQKILRTFAAERTTQEAFSTTTNGTIRSIDDSYLLHRVLDTAPRASLARRSHCRRHSSDRYALLPPQSPRGRALASDTTPPLLSFLHTLHL